VIGGTRPEQRAGGVVSATGVAPRVPSATLRRLAAAVYYACLAFPYRTAPGLARRLRLEMRLGALVGRLHARSSPARLAAVREALVRAAGDGSRAPAEVDRVVRESFRHRWIHAEPNELISLRASPAARRARCRAVRVEGLEHLRAALARGSGALLWESPFGTPLLGKAVLTDLGFPCCWLHSESDLPVDGVAADSIAIRSDDLSYLEEALACLRSNGILVLNALGRFGHGSVDVRLLGARWAVSTGAVSLARSAGAPILPVFCFRDDEGRERLVVESPIDAVAEGRSREEAVREAAQRHATLLERYVLRHPAQWRRWAATPRAVPTG
jgi:lauroyl/myristoyl acyltransferase